jgi:hypothetical protein
MPVEQDPQLPPHPSSPHIFPEQFAVQLDTQVPPEQIGLPVGQVPQLPPHPSAPQTLAVQFGAQAAMHVPSEQTGLLPEQEPQFPPQPSLPQVLPAQLGAQSATQVAPLQIGVTPPQVPHVPPQPSLPQKRPAQSRTQDADGSLDLHAAAPMIRSTATRASQLNPTILYISAPIVVPSSPAFHGLTMRAIADALPRVTSLGAATSFASQG